MEDRVRTWFLIGMLGAVMTLYVAVVDDKEQLQPLTPGAGVFAEVPAGSRGPTVDETVLAILKIIERGEGREGLEQLSEVLQGGERGDLSLEVRDRAAKAVITAYAGFEDEESKRLALHLIVAKLGGEVARNFAVELMGSTTDAVKLAVVHAYVQPGAANGKALKEKVLEYARSEVVPVDLRPAVLRRALGLKSEPELFALFSSEIPQSAVAACAVELQNLGKPEVMGPVLSRLDALGMLDDKGRMPWISGKLLSKHIQSASDEELERALRIVTLRKSLVRSTARAVKERAGHKDPGIRRLVARIIPNAVKNEGLDVASGEELLLARLKEETDPSVKGEIEGSLAEVRKTRPAPEASPEAPAVP